MPFEPLAANAGRKPKLHDAARPMYVICAWAQHDTELVWIGDHDLNLGLGVRLIKVGLGKLSGIRYGRVVPERFHRK